ncbi:MAG: hypothetical protein GY856_16340 [bacterium]|nr:hypothetical protein [bacterium]
MNSRRYPYDLVCLVADNSMRHAVLALLGRHQSLNIRLTKHQILVHPEHDPGCLRRSQDFLRPFVNRAAYALILFDREGCGQESSSREKLESDLERRLSEAGWGDRSAVIAIDPELETWIWSDSPHVDAVLGWRGRTPDLRSWLREHAFLDSGSLKPHRPKEAVEKVLWIAGKPRSSSLYRQLAERVSLANCIDPAFSKLKNTLQAWFPPKAISDGAILAGRLGSGG